MERSFSQRYPCLSEFHQSFGLYSINWRMQAYKHIFTSPSSVEKEPKATRSGNARIHGMTKVTLPSLAYVSTQVGLFVQPYQLVISCPQVRFALSSSPVFSRTDTVTDSERFYNSVLDLFEDPEEIQEVNDLQTWWNRCEPHYPILILSYLTWGNLSSQIFPYFSSARHPLCKDSALARIKEKRRELKLLSAEREQAAVMEQA